MKPFLILLTLSLSLLSCKKECGQPLNQRITGTKDIDLAKPIRQIYSLHPFDSMGILHNQILDSLRRFILKTGNTSIQNWRKYIAGYYARSGQNVMPSFKKLPPQKVKNIIKNYLNGNFGEGTTNKTHSYLQDIFDTVRATNSFDTMQFRDRLLRLEYKILKDDSLLEGDKNMLLATAAIARHSGCYWLTFCGNPTKNVNARFGFLKKLATAIGVSLADASAAAYDYFSGQPMDQWVSDAAWFSSLGYWSMQHILNGQSY